MILRLFGGGRDRKFLRLFFTTDIHGSEKCFRKFINAGTFYKVDVIILGGDITGKMIVPIVEQPDGTYHSRFLDQDWTTNTSDELDGLEKNIRFNGLYPYRCSASEFEELSADSEKLKALFTRLMIETLDRWLAIAKEKLEGKGIRCFITGGNDDPPEITAKLKSHDFVVNPEGEIIDLDGRHMMISCGLSNPTPWRTPREVSEEKLEEVIEGCVSRVNNMENCIFNIHTPPINSTLDLAPLLDTSVYPPKPIIQGGRSVYVGVGSTAVRKAIEKYQPLLGLHGHIHESKGMYKIGRTMCFNPGSEYSEGIVRGIILNIGDKKIISYQMTSG